MKKIDYSKYTKEELIELLEIDDEGAFHLRNECDALNYRLEKIKDALIEANKRIDKAIEYIKKDNFNCKNQEEQIKFKTDLLNILKGEDNE